jgi:hypothetical protein
MIRGQRGLGTKHQQGEHEHQGSGSHYFSPNVNFIRTGFRGKASGLDAGKCRMRFPDDLAPGKGFHE